MKLKAFLKGDSTRSFVFSSCPFIKKRKNIRHVVFNTDITEYYVTYQQPAELDIEEEHIYHEPSKYFWPKNKHFFSRQVWQAIKRWGQIFVRWLFVSSASVKVSEIKLILLTVLKNELIVPN